MVWWKLNQVLFQFFCFPESPAKTQKKPVRKCVENTQNLRIGNGVGKQGYGNRPPIDDRNPIRKFSIDCLDASKSNDETRLQLTRHCRESKRKADTEFQYRPRIVDTDIDCGPRFCGPRFRDSYRKRGSGGVAMDRVRTMPVPARVRKRAEHGLEKLKGNN